MFMPRSEFIVVTRFEIPAESVFFRWPKHEVWRDFDTNRVRLPAVGVGVNPLGANPKHELHFGRKSPRLFEEKVRGPFCRVTSKQRRNAGLKFEPLLNRGDLNRDGGTEARVTLCETPLSSCSKLNDRDGFLLGRLREDVSSPKKQRGDQKESRGAHSGATEFHEFEHCCVGRLR